MEIDLQCAESTEADQSERQFIELYEANWRPVLGYALRRSDSAEAAADVVAETFLVAWRRIDSVPAGNQARPWLFDVARRVLEIGGLVQDQIFGWVR